MCIMVTWWHSAVSLHRHHTAVSAVFCTTHHKDVAGHKTVYCMMALTINILLQNSNWIIAAWAPGDTGGPELSGYCWFQYFQYHGTECCAMFCEPGAAAADITSAAARSLITPEYVNDHDHKCLEEQGKLGVLFCASIINSQCSAVQCVMYDVFFSFGTLVISFWMLLFPGPDVMSNGCVY